MACSLPNKRRNPEGHAKELRRRQRMRELAEVERAAARRQLYPSTTQRSSRPPSSTQTSPSTTSSTRRAAHSGPSHPDMSRNNQRKNLDRRDSVPATNSVVQYPPPVMSARGGSNRRVSMQAAPSSSKTRAGLLDRFRPQVSALAGSSSLTQNTPNTGTNEEFGSAESGDDEFHDAPSRPFHRGEDVYDMSEDGSEYEDEEVEDDDEKDDDGEGVIVIGGDGPRAFRAGYSSCGGGRGNNAQPRNGQDNSKGKGKETYFGSGRARGSEFRASPHSGPGIGSTTRNLKDKHKETTRTSVRHDTGWVATSLATAPARRGAPPAALLSQEQPEEDDNFDDEDFEDDVQPDPATPPALNPSPSLASHSPPLTAGSSFVAMNSPSPSLGSSFAAVNSPGAGDNSPVQTLKSVPASFTQGPTPNIFLRRSARPSKSVYAGNGREPAETTTTTVTNTNPKQKDRIKILEYRLSEKNGVEFNAFDLKYYEIGRNPNTAKWDPEATLWETYEREILKYWGGKSRLREEALDSLIPKYNRSDMYLAKIYEHKPLKRPSGVLQLADDDVRKYSYSWGWVGYRDRKWKTWDEMEFAPEVRQEYLDNLEGSRIPLVDRGKVRCGAGASANAGETNGDGTPSSGATGGRNMKPIRRTGKWGH